MNYQDFWAWNPATNTWTQVADFAGAARRYLVALTLGARVYAGTGTSGMNYNDWWEYGSISGIENDVATTEVKVFPMPAQESISFSLNKSINGTLTCVVYDINGKVVRVENFENGTAYTLNRNGLPAGQYTYSLTSDSRFIHSGKLIFQ